MRPVPLELSAKDRQRLRQMQSGGVQMTARRWRRISALLLLGDGLSARQTAKAVGCYPREVRRIGHRYREKGLEGALGDEPRPKPEPLLDSTQQAAVVAMVCGPPPEGRARWTVRLVAAEAVQRGIASRLGRETARVVLAQHGLKPWRASLVSRECLGRRRIESLLQLTGEVCAWNRSADRDRRSIEWKFRVDDARRVFRYDGLATARSRP